MMAIYQFLSEQGIIDDVPMNDEIDYPTMSYGIMRVDERATALL